MHVSQAWKQPITNSTLRVGAVGTVGTFGVEVKSTVRPDNFIKAHEKSGLGVADSKTLRASSCC